MMRAACLAGFLVLSTMAGAACGAETLAWRLEKGAVLRYRHSSRQESEHAPAAAPPSASAIRTSQATTVEYRLSVLDVDAATGAARVLCRYEQVAVELEQIGIGRLAWDSRKKEDLARADEPAVRPFARLVGQEFSFLLSPAGEVSDVRGHDRVRVAVLEGLGDDALTRALFGGAFADDAVRAQLERGFAVLPAGPVEAGATWDRAFEQPVPALGTLRYEVRSKLERLAGGKAEIAFEAKLARGAPAAPSQDPILARLEVGVEGGEASGRASFDLSLGRLARSEGTFRMKLSVRALPPVAPKEGPGSAAATSQVTERLTVELLGP